VSRVVVSQWRGHRDRQRGRIDQVAATAGRLMMGSSLNGAMIPAHVTSALDRPFVVLFEQQRPDQTRDGVVKMPTTSVRRLISPLRRSANPDPKKGLYSHRGPKGICWTVLQDPGCV
jgi:hypothetical protein